MPTSELVHPHQALAVYAEPLVVRRRAVVFGDPAAGVAEKLTELGARMAVPVAPGEPDDDLRPGSFDVALVLDLGIYDDPDRVLARASRLVGESGAVVVSAANRDAEVEGASRAFDYYELFDQVAAHFADVRMVAVLPFHGVAMAELGLEGESPDVSVDTQLADGRRVPDAFVVVASQRGAALDPYSIVELPAPERIHAPAEVLDATVAALARETLRADALILEVETLKSELGRVGELEREAVDLERDVTVRGQAIAELEREVAARGQAIAELDREVAVRGQAIAELDREVVVRGKAIVELSAQVEGTRASTEASVIAAAQLEELAMRAERAERTLAQFEPELGRVADGHAAELARFEDALRDRGQAVRELEAELARRDRMIKDLVGALEDQGPRAAPEAAEQEPSIDDSLVTENVRLRGRLDAMALELARREGEAQATTWTIAELERRLAQASTVPPTRPDGDAQARLDAALEELDALRRALTQEHDQRVRAEAAAKRPAGGEIEPQV
jgi:hypothetical protein